MRKKLIYFLVFAFFFITAFILFYPSKNTEKISRSEIIMGTLVEIQIESRQDNLEKIIENTFNEIKKVDTLFSNYIEESETNKFNRFPDSVIKVSNQFYYLLSIADSINKLSDGAFDIAINNIIKLWDFDSGGKLPHEKKLKEKIAKSGSVEVKLLKGNTVSKKEGLELNFGAIAKGYAVDKAYEYLGNKNIERAFINAGGEIKVIGEDWVVGVQHPRDENKSAMQLKLSNTSIATSGDYEKYFFVDEKRYHHIIDPATGYPPSGVQSVTIINKSNALADALSTAVFVLGVDKGLKLINRLSDTEAFIIDSAGTYHYSNEFKKYLINK